ncbi:hypothetical protein ACI2OX_19855 [Bacillus sp. N9]
MGNLFNPKWIIVIILIILLSLVSIILLTRLNKGVHFIVRLITSIVAIPCFILFINFPGVFSTNADKEIDANEKYEILGFIGAF